MLTTEQLRDLDREYLWHPFTHMKQWLADEPLVITGADGMYLIDSDGNRYLDGVSSLWCNVHGHRVPEIDAAIRGQLDSVAHSTMLGLASEPAILLGERLMATGSPLAEKGLLQRLRRDGDGSGVQAGGPILVQHGRREKCEFVGFAEGYHGDTVGAMSVGACPPSMLRIFRCSSRPISARRLMCIAAIRRRTAGSETEVPRCAAEAA